MLKINRPQNILGSLAMIKPIFLVSIFVFLLSNQAIAADNLSSSDYIGIWESSWTVVEGEKQRLIFDSNLLIIFERQFDNEENQKFETKNIELIGDILIIRYDDKDDHLIYKLVLSGWKSSKTKRLYGTLYMYKNGKQFNGLPLSFMQ